MKNFIFTIKSGIVLMLILTSGVRTLASVTTSIHFAEYAFKVTSNNVGLSEISEVPIEETDDNKASKQVHLNFVCAKYLYTSFTRIKYIHKAPYTAKNKFLVFYSDTSPPASV